MNNFDWIFYSNFYTDIKAANINTEEKALEHYKTHGKDENRRINIDIDRYLKNNDIYGESLFSSINNDSLYGISRSFLTYIVKECKLPIDSKILEIGCGVACLALPIIKHAKQGKYYGLDTNKSCVEWCSQKISPLCNATFKHVIGDKFVIPCEDNELDMVYTTTIFLALPIDIITQYLNEIHRVLKKGGHLIFTTFIWNQSAHPSIKAKKIKTRFIKSNNISYLSNSQNEQVIIHSDNILHNCLENAQFAIHETIFGNWNDMSNSSTFQDIINTIKMK